MGTGGGHRSLDADPVLDYIAGCVAGSANITSGFPFDTVKVRLQASGSHYRGPWDAFITILRAEGVRGLYRGLTPPLIGGAVETGVNYAVYQAMLQSTTHPSVDLPAGLAIPLSAGTAGFFLSFVLSPAELIKCRMQLGAMDSLHSYSGPLDCLRQVVRSEGLAGLARGLGGTMAREMPGNAIYFSSYEMLRRVVPGRPVDRRIPRSLWQQLQDAASAIMCGGLAGMAMWATVLPIDVAKTRIQTAWPGTPLDVGVARQLQLLYAEGGLRSLYAGLSPTLIRAFPANAAQWLAWELCAEQLYKWRDR
ncbi:hypothetical protein N2152v2_009872 [Parachlorella kessleri]